MISKNKTEMVSVIIPAYNIEKYIGRCIESILHQTYSDIEIIVVDDGSTDKTGKIADIYCSDRVTVLHQNNLGVSVARLNGVRAAHGEWIGFIDGDDAIDSDMYERLITNAQSHNAQISHCGYRIEKADKISYYYNTNKKIVFNNADGVKELLKGTLFEPSICNKLYKKSLFDNLPVEKIKSENIRNMEDLLVNYYLFKNAGSTVFEDLCMYRYIKRDDSASSVKLNNRIFSDILKVFYIIREEESGENAKIINGRIVASLISCTNYERKNGSCYIDAKKKLKIFLKEISEITLKYKILGYMEVYFPWLYEKIHKLHLMISI